MATAINIEIIYLKGKLNRINKALNFVSNEGENKVNTAVNENDDNYGLSNN